MVPPDGMVELVSSLGTFIVLGTFVAREPFVRLMVMKGPKPPISTNRATSRTRIVSTLSMLAPVRPAKVCA